MTVFFDFAKKYLKILLDLQVFFPLHCPRVALPSGIYAHNYSGDILTSNPVMTYNYNGIQSTTANTASIESRRINTLYQNDIKDFQWNGKNIYFANIGMILAKSDIWRDICIKCHMCLQGIFVGAIWSFEDF